MCFLSLFKVLEKVIVIIQSDIAAKQNDTRTNLFPRECIAYKSFFGALLNFISARLCQFISFCFFLSPLLCVYHAVSFCFNVVHSGVFILRLDSRTHTHTHTFPAEVFSAAWYLFDILCKCLLFCLKYCVCYVITVNGNGANLIKSASFGGQKSSREFYLYINFPYIKRIWYLSNRREKSVCVPFSTFELADVVVAAAVCFFTHFIKLVLLISSLSQNALTAWE